MLTQSGISLRGGGWEAEVFPQYGMSTLSLRWKGEPVLRSPAGMEEFLLAPETYGTPVLLPANRTDGGAFVFDGQQYFLPVNEPLRNNHKHGSLHLSPFAVTRQSEAAVEGRFVNTGACFPFPFQIDIACRACDGGYLQTITVTNTGPTAMPVMLAIHAAFAAPKRLAVPIGKMWVLSDRLLATGELAEPPEELAGLADGIDPEAAAINGCFAARGGKAEIGDYTYEVSELFTQWIVWNGGGGKGFVCVEPQSGPNNALNMPGHCLRLERGDAACFATCIGRR